MKEHTFSRRCTLPRGYHFVLDDPASSLAEATAFLMARGTDIVIHKGGSAVAVE